ncbi:hypothetical protein SEGD1_033 [Enterobacteria phage SEGD1]|uniref:Uncharacterized protein n=1 Tax=Enterobacteria phage SEGD1 TaxID=1805456 RepID=A0A142II94_9CAUD|nr:hypothetical protein SEGD1_033 [Enterobacteria phage SEGD1]
MQLVNLLMYPVYDVPEQVRRRIGFNASTGALDDLAAAVELGGEKAVGTQQYQEALSAIVGFDAPRTVLSVHSSTCPMMTIVLYSSNGNHVIPVSLTSWRCLLLNL